MATTHPRDVASFPGWCRRSPGLVSRSFSSQSIRYCRSLHITSWPGVGLFGTGLGSLSACARSRCCFVFFHSYLGFWFFVLVAVHLYHLITSFLGIVLEPFNRTNLTTTIEALIPNSSRRLYTDIHWQASIDLKGALWTGRPPRRRLARLPHR
jgi:hypothetical protein